MPGSANHRDPFAQHRMRVVFNGQRHCYVVRDALATEPAWLLQVRSSWRDLGRAGRLPPEALPAAARLLRTGDLPDEHTR